jgi:hypothetical protein
MSGQGSHWHRAESFSWVGGCGRLADHTLGKRLEGLAMGRSPATGADTAPSASGGGGERGHRLTVKVGRCRRALCRVHCSLAYSALAAPSVSSRATRGVRARRIPLWPGAHSIVARSLGLQRRPSRDISSYDTSNPCSLSSTFPFFLESETSTVFRITYSTGIKNRFRTVENNMPPTIAVPTECRPSLPAPDAK